MVFSPQVVRTDPIVQSKLQLTGKGQTKVDALYDATVTKATNVFSKFTNWIRFQFGKVSSTSAYSQAQAQDAAIKAACKDFNDATTELIRAAFAKNFSNSEANELGIPTFTITDGRIDVISYEQNKALALNTEYNAAVKKFNQAFNAALVAGNPNPTIETTNNFMRGAIAALVDEKKATRFGRNDGEVVINPKSKGIFSSKTVTQIELPEQKLNMTISSFVNSVYQNEFKRFANQEVANITLDSIAAQVEHLKQLFPENPNQNIIKDLCASLMGNPTIAQVANDLLDPEAILATVNEQCAALNVEKQEILTRLAQLYTEPVQNPNSIFEGGTFTFEAQLDQAWKDWRGYRAAGRASDNPGKVIISFEGTEVEVDGEVISSNGVATVSVDGKEEVAWKKCDRFVAEVRNYAAVTASADRNSLDSFSAVLEFDPSALAPQIAAARADALNAVDQNGAAKQHYETLDAERRTKEARLREINDQNYDQENRIRCHVTNSNGKRASFLNLFVPGHEHGLDTAADQLTHLLDERARTLRAIG